MKFSTFIILVLLVLGGYAVVRIAPGYITDFQIQSMTKMAAEMYADPGRNSQVEGFLRRKFSDNVNLPVTRDDVKIEDNDDTVRVYVDWTYEARFIPKNEFVPAYSRFYRFHEETIKKLKR